jgi:hypothetical protein
LLKFYFKNILIFEKSLVFFIDDVNVYITADKGCNPGLSVSFYKQCRINNVVFALNIISRYIVVAVELEDLCFKLSAVSEVEIRLCYLGVTVSVVGTIRYIHLNVTYLKGV